MSLPTTSRAAVLREYGGSIEVEAVAVPTIEPRAALVRVEASTLCGTDLSIWRGNYASAGLSTLPLIPGHEAIGRVVALGRDRTVDALGRPLAEGDRISWSYAWCGQCYWCTVARQPTLCEKPRMYGWGPMDAAPHLTGGASEYAYVMPECDIVKVAETLPAGLLSTATCAFRSVIHAFDRAGRVDVSDTVVVQGSGAVGLYALALAQQMGARQVIVIGAPESRLRIAERWGATAVLDVTTTTAQERRDFIHGLTDGRGADVVVECSGARTALSEGTDLARRGGRYLVMGGGSGSVEISPLAFSLKQLTVSGSFSGDITHYHRALSFLEDHADRYPFGDLLGTQYPLEGLEDAFAGMAAGTQIKPVVTPLTAE